MTMRHSRNDESTVKRRSVLKTLGAGAGVAGVGGLSSTVSADGGDEPEIGKAIIGAKPGDFSGGGYDPGDEPEPQYCTEICTEWHWSLDTGEIHCANRQLCCEPDYPHNCPGREYPPFIGFNGPLGGDPVVTGAHPVTSDDADGHLDDALGDDLVQTIDGQLQAQALESHLDHAIVLEVETDDDELTGRTPVTVSIPYSGSGMGSLTAVLADSASGGRAAEYVVGRTTHREGDEITEHVHVAESDGTITEHSFEWQVLDEFDPDEDPEPVAVTLGNLDNDPGYDAPCLLPGFHHPDCDNWATDGEPVPGFSNTRYHV